MAEKNPFFRKLDDAINRYREETGKEPGYITMSVMMFGLFCREADPYLTKDIADRIPPEGNFYCGIPIHVDLRQRNDCISVHGCEKEEKELKPCPFCGRTWREDSCQVVADVIWRNYFDEKLQTNYEAPYCGACRLGLLLGPDRLLEECPRCGARVRYQR